MKTDDELLRFKLASMVRTACPRLPEAAVAGVVDDYMRVLLTQRDAQLAALLYGDPHAPKPMGILQVTRRTNWNWVDPKVEWMPDPRDTALLHRSFEAFRYDVERKIDRSVLYAGRPWLSL